MSERFQIGQQVGDYRILGFIGMGGMGEVYHAVHTKLGRPVAVKVLGASSELNESFKTRFFNEARLQASLHHPNIATLYDFQESGGQLYIFMEFVDGDCLGDLIDGHAMAVEDALRTFKPIVEAIGYVHSNGIVHRDIKDQNIKMTAAGIPKLLDFGIAKDSSSHNLTSVGGVIGTPHYLSPEHLSGLPSSPQTDIWALGILLYKMLTGKVPFDAEDLFSLHMQIKSASFAPAEQRNPAVPREVSQIIAKCLARETTDRYQSASDLLGDLDEIIQRRYVSRVSRGSGSTTAVGTYSGRSARKPIALAIGAAMFLVVALIGIGIWAFSGSGGTRAANNAQANTNIAVATNEKGKAPVTLKSGSAQPGSKKVRIDVIEGKAEVFREGQTLGMTPVDVESVAGQPVKLTLRRPGYQEKEVRIEASGSQEVYTFSLTPLK